MADTTMDYPLSGELYSLMDKVQSKTICSEFDEQLDVSEKLYKMNLKFKLPKEMYRIYWQMQRYIRKKYEAG